MCYIGITLLLQHAVITRYIMFKIPKYPRQIPPFIELHGVSPQHFGFFFGANACGLIGASQVNHRLLHHFSAQRIMNLALAPSMRLQPFCLRTRNWRPSCAGHSHFRLPVHGRTSLSKRDRTCDGPFRQWGRKRVGASWNGSVYAWPLRTVPFT